jgi:hypothetical protein
VEFFIPFGASKKENMRKNILKINIKVNYIIFNNMDIFLVLTLGACITSQ